MTLFYKLFRLYKTEQLCHVKGVLAERVMLIIKMYEYGCQNQGREELALLYHYIYRKVR